MNKLTKTVLQRPVAALVIVVSLIIFGIGSVMGMNLQLIPDMDMPVMMIMTVYPQAGPEDVERLVTREIEEGCGTIAGLDGIYSQSMENMSMAMFSFEYGTDMDDAFIDMQSAVERIKPSLPEDAQDPIIIAMDMNAMPVMTLSADSSEDVDVLYYVEETLQPELEKISDVAEVEISGGKSEYISVQLIPELMKQYHLNISSVASAVASANYTIPAGTADYGNQELNISSTTEYNTPVEIGTIPITTPTGHMIHLSDIAHVQYAVSEASSLSRYNNGDNVSISITKTQSASAVNLSRDVLKVIERLNEQNPEVNIKAVYDSSEAIVSSLKSIGETLVLGIIITMLILFLFFGDFKGSLIVGSSMPISLLVTFILMNFMGFSLNMLTMGALVIGIGMMVDNAIVVIEMCFRKKDEGMDFKEAAYEATKQVMASIVASTITTVVVYLPLSTMKGMSGQMFGQLGYTIVFALLASLFSAITLVPLCFSKYRPIEKKESKVNKILDIIGEKYAALLRKALHRKKLVAFISVVIFIISVALFKFVNMELMPQTDEGQVAISVEFRPGMKLDVVDKKIRELEAFVAESPYIADYSAMVNGSTGTVEAYVADECKLSTAEIVDEWTVELEAYEESCEISVASSSSMGMSMGGGNTYDVSLESKNLESLKEACRMVSDILMETDGVLSATHSFADAATKAEIVIDPVKATAAGLSPQQVSGSIYSMMSGSDAMDVMVDNREYTVRVEYPADEYPTMNEVMGITLTNMSGKDVPLSDIAKIVYTDSPQAIMRQNNMYMASVTATLAGGEAKFEAQKNIQAVMEDTILPEGVGQITNTMDEMMIEEFTALIKAIVIATLLVYIVMAIQFENLRYSGMVMFCIPFSLIGSILLLLISRCTLNMTSLMGFLMLIGVVVNNGILYVDYTNMLRKTMSTEDALVETGKSRLRPILMTTLTTILSMVPMALGIGKNGEQTQGMAVVIVGGLTASTILTLILLPTFYMIIHKRSKDKKQKKKKMKKSKAVKES